MSLPEEARNCRLLKSDELKLLLETEFKNCQKIVLVSAYVTCSAVEWLIKHASLSADIHLIARLSPLDFMASSSDFKGLDLALERGIKCGMLENLHAKLYVLDDRRIFVGSANFTTYGLNLFGEGNLEICVEADCSNENLKVINKIIHSASMIDRNILAKMKGYIADNANTLLVSNKGPGSIWPEDIIPRDHSVWVYDFPWVNLREKDSSRINNEHDIKIFSIDSDSSSFLMSKAFHWLTSALKESPAREMYFGTLSQKLHNDLSDDPRPYRQNVKQLLANLLSYCKQHASEYILIDVPGRHSERIRFIKDV